MEELYRAGKIRPIGVCNFLPDCLVDLVLNSEIIPMVNQIELHPFCQQKELLEVMKKYQIQPMAWAPFAEGQNHIFRNEVLEKIGKIHGKSAAQVILRWLRQSGIVAIPKSVHENRIAENFTVGDFSLTGKQMEEIRSLDAGHSLILDIQSLEEVYRLKGICFRQ